MDFNWQNRKTALPKMVYACANFTLEGGYRYFGLQDWGECWVGDNGYDKHGKGMDDDSLCSVSVGGPHRNQVYRFLPGTYLYYRDR